uniref:Uncharacterized protein n=1 Tax=Cannabis sativa TaxID=3483 RepID=A0A803R745_CANSA
MLWNLIKDEGSMVVCTEIKLRSACLHSLMLRLLIRGPGYDLNFFSIIVLCFPSKLLNIKADQL